MFSKKKPSQKVAIVEEKLDDIDIDDFVILEGLPELVFINEECGNPKVAMDGGELNGSINQTFNMPVDAHSVTNVLRESISLISMWKIVNQLGKYDFLVFRF